MLQCTAVQQAMALSGTHLRGFGLQGFSHAWEVRLGCRRRSPSMWLPQLGSSTMQGPSHLSSLAALKCLTFAPQASFKAYKSSFPPPVGNALQLPMYPCLKAPHPDVIHSPVLPARQLGRSILSSHRPSPSISSCLPIWELTDRLVLEELTTSCLFGNAFKLFQKLLFVDKSGRSQRSVLAKLCKRRNELQRSTASCHWI